MSHVYAFFESSNLVDQHLSLLDASLEIFFQLFDLLSHLLDLEVMVSHFARGRDVQSLGDNVQVCIFATSTWT